MGWITLINNVIKHITSKSATLPFKEIDRIIPMILFSNEIHDDSTYCLCENKSTSTMDT